MVSYVPSSLRNEKELKEYFEYYMSRKVDKPSVGLTSSTQPGLLNKLLAFVFNRAKRLPAHLPHAMPGSPDPSSGSGEEHESSTTQDVPVIERVVIARKMTELASLLERREETLRLLETAHIKLARRTLMAVSEAMERKAAGKSLARIPSRAITVAKKRKSMHGDVEFGDLSKEINEDGEHRMEVLIEALQPFVDEFDIREPYGTTVRARKAFSNTSKKAFKKLHTRASDDSGDDSPNVATSGYPPPPSPVDGVNRPRPHPSKTVWDALLSVPRNHLDGYQPLINLSHVFNGKIVPSIDYYTAKLNLLSSLITENRAKSVTDFAPVSTAFVTFASPLDARKACKYLAVHPNNPLTCLVTMAPQYQDLDWIRVMKSPYNVEFVKDWVVSMGVWGFTIFWIFPVSLLKAYLDKHPWESEVLQSFLPTLLVALLALLIPLILLFIAKKAHTIATLSALHDRIMTRYYKFLIVNVLVFFCVGTAALQSVLLSFRAASSVDVIQVVAASFPTAGPFYVGWPMHACFELAMFGLALIVYPTTRSQVTPRKRAVGVRPRTLNFYYWLPNHMLVLHVLLLFTVLNPIVIPFATLYFFVQSGVIKNQFIHVYAKHYEGNGQVILIRVIRYSLDGLILCQAVFLAYMVVLKKTVNVGLAACLIIITAFVKIFMTRICRAQFEQDDITEAEVLCGSASASNEAVTEETMSASDSGSQDATALIQDAPVRPPFTWKFPKWPSITSNTVRHRPKNPLRRKPIPFGSTDQPFKRLGSVSAHNGEGRNSRSAARNGLSQDIEEVDARQDSADSSQMVRPHPPPLPWDDETTCDLPYDNPYYSRPITNALWLPRNPNPPSTSWVRG
ncbi:hypothetical protein ONZ45_g17188 [Pleurotus djamor]|nr:hypothetical protein ONZ45_g17188 [Pleurotus djamor]